MLFFLLYGVVALVAILALVVVTRPAAFTVQRSLFIPAPPQQVYAQVVDFRAWVGWSPWEGRDPHLKRTYGEVASGLGATYHWHGNKQVGEGSMTITDDRPGEHLGIDLVFIRPFAAKNRTTFDFTASGDGTNVTWTMSGHNNFVGKAFSLVMDVDRMVGRDFEQGLEQMKQAVAKAAARAAGHGPG